MLYDWTQHLGRHLSHFEVFTITDVCLCKKCCMLTQPFLPQASRQFDQEGRKKFFTLDMNNILLEWVGRLLNHSQANCNSLSSFYQLFSLISSRFPRPPLLLSKCFVFSLSPIVTGNDTLRISIHPALIPLPLPTVLAHPPLQSPISVFYSAFFLLLLFSNHLDFLSVLSCRSRSSLLRCAQASIRTWRHLYRATKRPSSSASKSSASTSRWAKLLWRKCWIPWHLLRMMRKQSFLLQPLWLLHAI